MYPCQMTMDTQLRFKRETSKNHVTETSMSIDVLHNAPPVGATLNSNRYRDIRPVSIHAPARGATQRDFHLVTIHKFQSTHPQGVRQRMAYIIVNQGHKAP